MGGRARAGEFFSDFNSGVPAGTHVYGDAMVNNTGGVDDTGVLRLTPAETDKLGTFIVDDLDPGQRLGGASVIFRMYINNGLSLGADGIGFAMGQKLPHAMTEGGSGRGLVVMFDTFVPGQRQPPAVVARFNSVTLAKESFPSIRSTNFNEVEIRFDTDHMLNVYVNGQGVLTNVAVQNFKAEQGIQFGFGARTARLMDYHLIDNLQIVTTGPERPLPSRDVIAAKARKQTGLRAERFFYVSDGDVLPGCIYKPEGDGPFPVILFSQRSPKPLPAEGIVNPLPRLGEFFTSKNYVVCLPVEMPGAESVDASGNFEEASWTKTQTAGKHIDSVVTWLSAQAFVDPKRIVLMGDGMGANATMVAASKNKSVRGSIFFSPDAGEWPTHPNLQSRFVAALTEATAPVLLLQPANVETIDAFFALRTVIDGKEKPNNSRLCQPFGQGAAALNFAVEGSDGWKEDVFSFLQDVFTDAAQ